MTKNVSASRPARIDVLRRLVGAYVAIWSAVRAPHILDTLDFSPERFDAVGPLWFLNSPLPSFVLVIGVLATPVSATLMTLGVRLRVSASVTAIGFLLVTTYRTSWGNLFHTENLVALHLVVLAVMVFDDRSDRRWAVDAMAVLTVGTYFVAGVAKLRISGTAWFDGDVLRNQIAFDNARKAVLGDVSSPFAVWLLGQGWLLAPAAIMSIGVELGAPLALLHRRVAGVWAALAMGFHLAILVFMAIFFPYHVLGIGLAPLLPVERLGTTVSAWTARFRPALKRSPPTG